MPTSSSQHPPAETLPNGESFESPTLEPIADSDQDEAASEVSKRINLLGKLIVPRAPD